MGTTTYDQFKQKIYRIAKKNKVSHLIPNNDILFTLFQFSKLTPEEIVKHHCTLEAQKLRHEQ